MQQGNKVVRCGARRSEPTCKAAEKCEWDKSLQKCKQKAPGVPSPKKQSPVKQSPKKQSPVKQSPVKPVKSPRLVPKPASKPSQVPDCTLKTKAACIKRSNCIWENKTCKVKDLRTNVDHPVSPAYDKSPLDMSADRSILQAKVIKEAVSEVAKMINSNYLFYLYAYYGNYGQATQTDYTPASPTHYTPAILTTMFKLRVPPELPENWTNPKCVIDNVKLQLERGKAHDKSVHNRVMEINENLNKQLLQINPFPEDIELKPLNMSSRATMAIMTQFLGIVYKTGLSLIQSVSCYHNNNGMGFFAYNGCVNPSLIDKSILGHRIWNVSDTHPHMAKYLSSNNLVRYTGFESYGQVNHPGYNTPLDIVHAYIGGALGFTTSTELNVSMMMYMQEAEAIDKTIVQRILTIIREFQKVQSLPLLYDKPILVFHGTTQAIHRSNRFVTCSFMSTTTKASVAMTYAGNGGGTIYVIEVASKFPFLNFRDSLEQILLPVGTSIIIDKSVFIKGIRFVMCHVETSNIDLNPFLEIFTNPCTKQSKQIVLDSYSGHPLVMDDVQGMTCIRAILRGSSKLYTCSKLHPGAIMKIYIVKDIVKASQPIRLLSNDQHVFIRVVNELLASVIYREVYGIRTFDMKLIHSRNLIPDSSKFLLASPKIDGMQYFVINIGDKEAVLKGFLIDCIMGNWDVYNNNNIGMHNNIPIRTDVGGCLAFRGKGDYNMSYDVNVTPRDHIAISQQHSFRTFVKTLSRKQTTMLSSCQYLSSIQDVKQKLTNVKEQFLSLLAHIQDATERDRYTKFVNKIISTVQYRDEWYRKHCQEAIAEALDVPDIANNVAHVTNAAQDQVHSPIAFVMTPRKLQTVLENRVKCIKQRL